MVEKRWLLLGGRIVSLREKEIGFFGITAPTELYSTGHGRPHNDDH